MLAYLTRVLKTPTIGRCWEELADQARDETWSHEEYLAAVLQRQVAERESAGTTMRIRTAHFPAVKTLEDFNLDHLPSLRRDVLAHLATGTFVAKTDNVILLGPPGLGKTHLAIGLGVKAAHAGYSVLFDTANNWITRLADAHQAGRLETELKKIRRYKLIIIDLCRHRDYAELQAVRPGDAGSRRIAARHSHRLSRNARTLSGGR
jgi:DNA replication protein DnaC